MTSTYSSRIWFRPLHLETTGRLSIKVRRKRVWLTAVDRRGLKRLLQRVEEGNPMDRRLHHLQSLNPRDPLHRHRFPISGQSGLKGPYHQLRQLQVIKTFLTWFRLFDSSIILSSWIPHASSSVEISLQWRTESADNTSELGKPAAPSQTRKFSIGI